MTKNGFLLLMVLVFTSCTITKRVHNPGYHIEWKNKLSVKNDASADEINAQEHVLNENTISHDMNGEADENQALPIQNDALPVIRETGDYAIQENDVSMLDHEKTRTPARSLSREHILKNWENSEGGEDNIAVHPFIFISLGLLVASIITFILLFSGIAAGSGGAIVLLLLLTALLGLFSFIFALTARREITKSPQKWKGRSGALVLFVLGVVSFGVGILLWLIVLMILAIFKDINFDGFM